MERLLRVDNTYVYLYELSETETGYMMINLEGTAIIKRGVKSCSFQDAIRFDGAVELAISTMLSLPVVVRKYKRMHRNKPDQCIRFFTKDRDERFRIPNNNTVSFHIDKQEIIMRCHYVDNYHFRVNEQTHHVYDFGNLFEEKAFMCLPEKENRTVSSAYQVSDGFIVIIEFGNLYQGFLFDSNLLLRYKEENYINNRNRREIREEFLSHSRVEDDVMLVKPVHKITQLIRVAKYNRLRFEKAYAS